MFTSAFKEFQILQQDNPQSFHEWVLKSDFGSVFKMTANMYPFIVYFLKKHILFSLSKSSFSIYFPQTIVIIFILILDEIEKAFPPFL